MQVTGTRLAPLEILPPEAKVEAGFVAGGKK
jgi:hypothetical protein